MEKLMFYLTCNNDFGLQAQAHVNKKLLENICNLCRDITFNSGTDMTRTLTMDMNYEVTRA